MAHSYGFPNIMELLLVFGINGIAFRQRVYITSEPQEVEAIMRMAFALGK